MTQVQPSTTRFGTNHFASLAHAQRYYAAYGYTAKDVGRMIYDGDIAIGPPKGNPLPARNDESLSIDSDGRYHIVRRDK